MTFTDSTEVSNIFSSLNLDKSDRRNSTPTRVLKLLNKDMSDQLTFLFHQHFSPGLFPSILKNSKIIPVHKNYSKSDCSNHKPISLLSKVSKFWKGLCVTYLLVFLKKRTHIFFPILFLTETFSCSYSYSINKQIKS